MKKNKNRTNLVLKKVMRLTKRIISINSNYHFFDNLMNNWMSENLSKLDLDTVISIISDIFQMF